MATTSASNIEQARELMRRSRRERFAVGAFNVDNQETLLAIVRAAQAKAAPVLVEVSHGLSSQDSAVTSTSLRSEPAGSKQSRATSRLRRQAANQWIAPRTGAGAMIACVAERLLDRLTQPH